MIDFNMIALNGIDAPDAVVSKIFNLYGKGASLNWELLHKAKDYCLERFPDAYVDIMEDFETEMYWTKRKLAKRGLLYENSVNAEAFNDDELEEDLLSMFREEEDEHANKGI